MYKIQIDTRSQKTYIMNCENPSDVKEKIDKDEMMVLDMGVKGIYIPKSEIAVILFEKLQDEISPAGLTTDSQEHYPSTDANSVSPEVISINDNNPV